MDKTSEDNGLEGLFELFSKTLSKEGQELSFVKEGEVTFLNRSPTAPESGYLEKDGLVYVPWTDKFQREQKQVFPPFQEGENVLVSGFLQKDPAKGYYIHIDQDGRVADNFYLANMADSETSGMNIGMPMEAIVEVLSEIKADFQLSDVWNYNSNFVKVVSRPPINPDLATVAELPSGKRVIVTGEFMGFAGKPKDEWYGDYESGFIKTNDGREIYLDFPTGKITLSGGVLENLYNKHPKKGDILNIATYVTRAKREPKILKEGIEVGTRLAANRSDPCYLEKPSKRRVRVYERLRGRIGRVFDLIEKSNNLERFGPSRYTIGMIKQKELTSAEWSELDKIVNEIPQEEQPFQVKRIIDSRGEKRDFYIDDIETAYEVCLEGMKPDEYLKFTKEVLSGRLARSGKKTDLSYLFHITGEAGMPKETIEELTNYAIQERLKKIESAPEKKAEFEDTYLIEQSFMYLAGLGTESSSEKMFDYLNYIVDKKYYNLKGECDDFIRSNIDLLYKATAAIEAYMDRMPEPILKKRLPDLYRIATNVAKDGHGSVALNNLERTMEFIEKTYFLKETPPPQE